MKPLNFFNFLFIIFLSALQAFAETTAPSVFEYQAAQPDRSCNIRIENSNYNIRSGPSRNHAICGETMQKSGYSSSILALGVSGNWIAIGHPRCPNQVGYVHSNAFYDSGVSALHSGQCAAMINYAPRNPGPTPEPNDSGSVGLLDGNTHRFILDRCLGIRSDVQGDGRYGASRRGRPGGHAGTDYQAPVGTSLKSPCSGRVSRSGFIPRGQQGWRAGNRIEITCDNGDKFKMLHLQHSTPPMLAEGTRVGPGTTVGKVGRTGNADLHGMHDHVHVEAIIRGERRNPEELWNCPAR